MDSMISTQEATLQVTGLEIVLSLINAIPVLLASITISKR